MALTARVRNGLLTVSGDAADATGFVEIVGNASSVLDNDDPATAVAIDRDGSVVRSIDARGLTGAGATIFSYANRGGVQGSEQGDAVYTYRAGSTVYGRGGNDTLDGDNGAETLNGGAGDDRLVGSGGADRLIGGLGADVIDGGAGADVAVYAGDRSDYDLTVEDGVFVLTDLRTRSTDGVDRLANVEQLQFRDGLFALPQGPSDLEANVRNSLLTVSGEAADATGFVEIVGNASSVLDNGDPATAVAIDRDGSAVRSIDARGLTGAGATIFSYANRGGVQGSEQGDAIYTYGAGSTVYGRGGNDTLDGDNGAETLSGQAGDDRIFGSGGADRLIGGRGADVIDGGAGADIAVYAGDRSDYVLTVDDGVFVLTDLRSGSPDGVDRLANVEQLQFKDILFDLPETPSNLDASVRNGVLAVSGEAAESDGFVEIAGNASSVLDNGTPSNAVEIDRDGSVVRTIDARGLSGAGATINSYATRAGVQGSEQGDVVFTYGAGSTVYGRGGNDALNGANGAETLSGQAGDDRIFGSGGADLLIGGRGADVIDGGVGADIAVYTGNRSNYALTLDDGVTVVTDLRSGSPDGVDRLANVEQLQFKDGLFDI